MRDPPKNNNSQSRHVTVTKSSRKGIGMAQDEANIPLMIQISKANFPE